MTECEIKSSEKISTNEKCEQCEMEQATYLVGVGLIEFVTPDMFYKLCENCKEYAMDIYLKDWRDSFKNRHYDKANLMSAR